MLVLVGSLIRSETMKTEVVAECPQQRITVLKLFAANSEIIREDPREWQNLTWPSLDLQFMEN